MFDWTEPPRRDQRLLDIGCAGGNDGSRQVDCSIVGLDEDPGAFAPQPTAARDPRYFGVLGNAVNMPLANASFDYVLCHHVLEHIAGPERALREIARVLKPEGGLSIIVPNGHGLCDGLYRCLFGGGGHVNRFGKDDELVRFVKATTGLHLARWRKLFSSFVYLSRVLYLIDAPPPGLQRRLLMFGRLPKRLVRWAHAALYLGTRILDRNFHTGLSLYGWAFYFTRSATEALELPAMANVCVHCGTGYPSQNLCRLGMLTCACPNCKRRTPVCRPFGNAV